MVGRNPGRFVSIVTMNGFLGRTDAVVERAGRCLCVNFYGLGALVEEVGELSHALQSSVIYWKEDLVSETGPYDPHRPH